MEYPKHSDVTEVILALAQTYQPARYLEIGTQKGYTFCQVAGLVPVSYAVDPVISKAVGKAATHAYAITSDEFFRTYDMAQGTFDMVFVDGMHNRDQVYRDLVGALHVVTQGTGLVLAHDTYPITRRLEKADRCGDAWKAVTVFERAYKDITEVLTLPGPYYGLTLIRKVQKGNDCELAHFGITRKED